MFGASLPAQMNSQRASFQAPWLCQGSSCRGGADVWRWVWLGLWCWRQSYGHTWPNIPFIDPQHPLHAALWSVHCTPTNHQPPIVLLHTPPLHLWQLFISPLVAVFWSSSSSAPPFSTTALCSVMSGISADPEFHAIICPFLPRHGTMLVPFCSSIIYKRQRSGVDMWTEERLLQLFAWEPHVTSSLMAPHH